MSRNPDHRPGQFLRVLALATLALLTLNACQSDKDAAPPPSPSEAWTPPEAALPPGGYPAASGYYERVRNREPLLPEPPYDLGALLDIALSRNPQLRSAWQVAKSAQAQLGQERSAYYPSIGTGASVERVRTENQIASDTQYETRYGPTARLDWLIFDFGRRENSTAAALNRLYAANFRHQRELQQTIVNVQNAYYGFISAKAAARAASVSLEDASTLLDATKGQVDAGLATRQDFLRAEANELAARFKLEQRRAAVETARANLALVSGLPVTKPLDVEGPSQAPEQIQLKMTVEEILAETMRRRPDLMAAYADLRANDNALKSARAEYLPAISASASGELYEVAHRSYNPTSISSAAISISWDLFDGFNRKYRILQRFAEREQAREQVRATELAAISQVWNFYYAFQSSMKQYDAARAALRSSNEAYEATRTGYESGVNDLLDLLSAQNDLALARQQKIEAENAVWTDLANLTFAAGGLDVRNPPPPIATTPADATLPATDKSASPQGMEGETAIPLKKPGTTTETYEFYNPAAERSQ